jgi:FkbM family methyltransferase
MPMASHIEHFLAKSWPERYRTAQFYLRQGLAQFPYLPVPVSLKVSSSETIDFWWSRVVPYHDDERDFLDYWGHDAGDLRFLWRALEPGMTFLDIGANEGVYSVVAAGRLAGTGRVIAFEPSPREHHRLELHLRWNAARNARAEQLAVGADAGRFTFYEVAAGGDTSRNGLRPPATSDVLNQIAVESVTLDEYVATQGIARVDVMKLDVEGGERDVFRGAARVLDEHRPTILCEALDAAAAPWGYAARELIESLAERGYCWFDVHDDGSLTPHLARSEYSAVDNFVAIPQERCSQNCAGGAL